MFAGLLLFFIGLPLLVVAMLASAARPAATPDVAVISLDLRGSLPDQDPQSPLAQLQQGAPSVMAIEQVLRRAESDQKVKALFVRFLKGGGRRAGAGAPSTRGAGKKIFVHSQGRSYLVVTSTYRLGTSGDELWMQPGAPFQVTGLASEEIFYKRFFDKWGIKPQYQQRYEYKNAVNPLLYDDFTAAHRESELSWMGSIYQTDLKAVAADRKMPEKAVQAAVEAGPYSADDAQAKGLVDKLGQVRDAQDTALRAAGPGAKLVDFDDYRQSLRGQPDSAPGDPVIAVVNGEGDISTGTGGGDLFSTSTDIHSDDLSEALYKAARDKAVKAIVFRVSSPGGGDTASEQILGAVRSAKAMGKPVVVSMGTYGQVAIDLVPGQRHRGRAHHPDRLDRGLWRQPAWGEGPGQVRRGRAPGGRWRRYLGLRHGQRPRSQAAGGLRQVGGRRLRRLHRAGGRRAPPAGPARAGDRQGPGVDRRAGRRFRAGGPGRRLLRRGRCAKALAGLAGKPVRPTSTPATSTLGIVGKLLGVSEDSARTLAAIGSVLSDRRVQGAMGEIHAVDLRSRGALVLAS